MRGRPRYVLPDYAYLTRIVLTHHPLDAMVQYVHYIYGFFCSEFPFSFFTTCNQTIGQCTRLLSAALISRITSKSFKYSRSHTSVSTTLLFAT